MVNLFGLGKKKRVDIALLVDGPNTIRKSVNIDLKEVKDELAKIGNLKVARIYLDQYASDKLIEAMVNQGFETEISTGDVDVTMAIEAMEFVLDPRIDVIALMTRDTDYIPVLRKAKLHGKATIIVATDVAFSAALRNTADEVMIMKGKGNVEHVRNQQLPSSK
jgi:uncharacterized protein (TIGR00288 family)